MAAWVMYVSGNVIRRDRLLEFIPPLLKVNFEPCAVEKNSDRGKPVKQNSFDCVDGETHSVLRTKGVIDVYKFLF